MPKCADCKSPTWSKGGKGALVNTGKCTKCRVDGRMYHYVNKKAKEDPSWQPALEELCERIHGPHDEMRRHMKRYYHVRRDSNGNTLIRVLECGGCGKKIYY